MPHELLTIKEAAKLLRMHPSSVYENVYLGKIPHLRIGRNIRIPREELFEVMRGHRRNTR